MFLISRLLGWERKVRVLRKRWNRTREKALKKKDPIRASLLQRLDQVEQNLRILEEQTLNRTARARLLKEVEIDIEEARAMLKMEPGEMQAARRTPYQEQSEQ